MTRPLLAALCLAAVFGLSACKIVKTAAQGDAAAADTDEGRMAARVAEDWPKITALIDAAPDTATLHAEIAKGLDAAGKAFGNRGAGENAAWGFAVQGEGTVISANLDSRARKAELDTDADGKPDLTLQLGPVIKGTALRDMAPFYVFSDFRDQIEYALLARSLNDRASAALALPDGDLTGRRIAFTGALSMKSATDPWLVTAVTIKALP